MGAKRRQDVESKVREIRLRKLEEEVDRLRQRMAEAEMKRQ